MENRSHSLNLHSYTADIPNKLAGFHSRLTLISLPIKKSCPNDYLTLQVIVHIKTLKNHS